MRLINLLFQFETKFLKGKNKLRNLFPTFLTDFQKTGTKPKTTLSDRLVMLQLAFMTVVCLAIGPTRTVRIIKEPCTPPFLGSIFLDCSGCGVLQTRENNYGIRALILIFEFYNFTAIFAAAFFYYFFTYLVAIHCLTRYLEMLIHDGNYGFLIYRQLQVLERALNDFGHLRILPATMAAVPVAQIVAFFIIIKLHDQIPLSGFLMYPVALIASFSGLAVMQTLSAKLMLESEKLVGKWKRKNTFSGVVTKNTKYRRRMIRSMQMLKVRFGSNFIDRDTTLVTQNFCLCQTVSLLILQY
jgi:hypothetical protein